MVTYTGPFYQTCYACPTHCVPALLLPSSVEAHSVLAHLHYSDNVMILIMIIIIVMIIIVIMMMMMMMK